MTRYSQGHRVRASVDMSFGLFSDVQEGEGGVVYDVDAPWVRETQYFVTFGGGVEGWVPQTNLDPAQRTGTKDVRPRTATTGTLTRVRNGIVDRSAELTADL